MFIITETNFALFIGSLVEVQRQGCPCFMPVQMRSFDKCKARHCSFRVMLIVLMFRADRLPTSKSRSRGFPIDYSIKRAPVYVTTITGICHRKSKFVGLQNSNPVLYPAFTRNGIRLCWGPLSRKQYGRLTSGTQRILIFRLTFTLIKISFRTLFIYHFRLILRCLTMRH